METSVTYTGETAYFSSDEMKWRNRISKLAQEHPDEVEILRRPEENDGCIYAKLPAEYLQITPKRHLNLTDEQRSILSDRMGKLRQKARSEM